MNLTVKDFFLTTSAFEAFILSAPRHTHFIIEGNTLRVQRPGKPEMTFPYPPVVSPSLVVSPPVPEKKKGRKRH
jgi:hypothetical protein